MITGLTCLLLPEDVNNIINRELRFEYAIDFETDIVSVLIHPCSMIRPIKHIKIIVDEKFYKTTDEGFEFESLDFFKEFLSKIIQIWTSKRDRNDHARTINFEYLEKILNLNKKELITEKIKK